MPRDRMVEANRTGTAEARTYVRGPHRRTVRCPRLGFRAARGRPPAAVIDRARNRAEASVRSAPGMPSLSLGVMWPHSGLDSRHDDPG
ncbi:hypothetical protein FRAAL5996 [Frankia alni ACN14a]|uniref:Uncharacterized protein n=1 Tax=Frankia alni (strain DSM 45986 / CECT 9034 / ACN14a) TaxID=326424 RepID=Q0RD53_FRAAA|nr:hypothetical protein FRAAL5996 [Frankia alni ACN14a]